MTIPEGWIPHDGGPCPVPLDSRPGVMFVNGSITPPGRLCAFVWTGQNTLDRLDCWTGEGRAKRSRIIAYLPESTP